MLRLRLGGRMTLYFSCLVLGLILSTFFVLGRLAEEAFHQVIAESLSTTQRVFYENLRRRNEEMISRCRLLADSPRLVAAVDTRDPPTILDIAQSLQEEIGSDLFTVTDPAGQALARTDAPGLAREDMSSLPLIRKAMSGDGDAATLVQDGQLYQVACVPLFDPQRHTIIGTLSIGYRIDDRLAGTLRQVTRSEVAFIHAGKVVASTLPSEGWPVIRASLDRVMRSTSELGEIRIGEDRYRGLWQDLSDGAGRTVGVCVILRSLNSEEAFLSKLTWWLTILGSGGIVTAVAASYLVARGLTRPLGHLAAAAGRIAAGDLDTRVEVRSSDEIGHLAGDFNRMAGSLRASRKALERLNEDLEVQVAQRTEELAASLNRIEVINRVTNVISSSLDLDQIGRTFAREVHRLIPFDRISIHLLTEDGESLEVLLRLNPEGGYAGGHVVPGGRFPKAGTSGGWVVDHGKPLVRNRLGEFVMDEALQTNGMRSAMQLPLISKGRTLGALNILSQEESAYSEKDLDALQPIVEQLAVAIEHSRLYRQEQMTVERLQEVSRLKSEFLANMSHELRTPMNSIIGFAELMQNPAFGALTAAQEDYLDTIHRNARHLLQLINDILDLSKIEAGKVEFHYRPFEVPRALEDAQVLIRSLASKKGLMMSCDIPDQNLTLNADETKFKQIMYNLLSNAVKFTPQGGRIGIQARVVVPGEDHPSPSAVRPGGEANGSGSKWVEISVSDTGIGIKPEDQDRIFNAFEQADGSYARHYEGTGLGLALTKRLVELQGGVIWVKSEANVGSTFTFVLPAERRAEG